MSDFAIRNWDYFSYTWAKNVFFTGNAGSMIFGQNYILPDNDEFGIDNWDYSHLTVFTNCKADNR